MENNIVTSLKKLNVPPDFLLSIPSFFRVLFFISFCMGYAIIFGRCDSKYFKASFYILYTYFLFESYSVFIHKKIVYWPDV